MWPSQKGDERISVGFDLVAGECEAGPERLREDGATYEVAGDDSETGAARGAQGVEYGWLVHEGPYLRNIAELCREQAGEVEVGGDAMVAARAERGGAEKVAKFGCKYLVRVAAVPWP